MNQEQLTIRQIDMLDPKKLPFDLKELLQIEAEDPFEADHPSGNWWLLPFFGEKGFLGAAIVLAPGPASAILESHTHNINPGDDVTGLETLPIPDDDVPPEKYRYRLLTRDDEFWEWKKRSIRDVLGDA